MADRIKKPETDSKEKEGFELVGRAVSYVMVAPMVAVNLLLHGFVAQRLWAWFATPVWGMPAPGLVYCVGLCMFTKYIVNGVGADKRAKTEEERALEYTLINRLCFTTVVHVVVLASAWLLSLLLPS